MKLYSVGPDETTFDSALECELEGCEWAVYWYESGNYDGSGELYAFRDGLIYSANLGHCSCYGPGDGGFNGKGIDPAWCLVSLLSAPEHAEVDLKVRELLGAAVVPSDERAFLETIKAHPEASGPVGVYSDWLEERGDARAEKMRLLFEQRREAERRKARFKKLMPLGI